MAAQHVQEILIPALYTPIPAAPVVAEDVFNASTLVSCASSSSSSSSSSSVTD